VSGRASGRRTAKRRVPADIAERIYRIVARIPRGSVSTYGWVAERAGFPRHARLVGHSLRVLPNNRRVPWHRVINAQGRISFPRGSPPYVRQRRRLEEEGVHLVGGRVNLKRFGWRLTLDELLWQPDELRRP
jgi:methylated-DNA-protein-cysteine methyltransferase-like protein